MLVADRLTFAYPGADRRYELSFVARPGEVTAVSGQSGAGKSTLLDLVAGFLAPQSGTLTLDDVDLLPLPPERRPISILFQTELLFEHLSALGNVELGLPADLPRAERRSRSLAALRQFGLEALATQRAATLSGGEKQRIALARTLIRQRPILLLDEPFSALDDETRAAIRQLLLDLTQKQNWITLLVSHHADDIAALAKRRYRLEDGQLIEG